jgi:hypothetical protein
MPAALSLVRSLRPIPHVISAHQISFGFGQEQSLRREPLWLLRLSYQIAAAVIRLCLVFVWSADAICCCLVRGIVARMFGELSDPPPPKSGREREAVVLRKFCRILIGPYRSNMNPQYCAGRIGYWCWNLLAAWSPHAYADCVLTQGRQSCQSRTRLWSAVL